MDPENEATGRVLGELEDERERQRRKWGNQHDDEHSSFSFARLIRSRIERLEADPNHNRRQFIEVATLAVAAIERIDRKLGYPHQ